jgi:hypothetical protein
MLCRLKIAVYDIAPTPPKVPKGSPDHDLHILLRVIGLNYLLLPFLCRRTKALLLAFTPPPLHRTLVTPTDQSPLLARPASMCEALSKSFECVSFCEFRTLLCSLIAYAVALKDLLDGSGLATEATSRDDLFIGFL